MKNLYIHIGLGKTGSSALQAWLSLNSIELSEQGIAYADLVPAAKAGKTSAGNGQELFQAFRENDFSEAERLLTTVYFPGGKADTAIVSSELLQNLQEKKLQKLREICGRNGISITVLAYVRSLYEWSYSTYLQGLKASGSAYPFGEISALLTSSTSVDILKRYLSVFSDRLLVVNYDGVKHDIYRSLAGVIGFDIGKMKSLNLKVNRSLTIEESHVLRQMNELHHGAFAKSISDFVIALSPDIETDVFYEPELVAKVSKCAARDIQWINDRFHLSPPLVSDFYSGQKTHNTVVLTKASYEGVVRWALDHKPDLKLFRKFVSFLRGFAVLLEYVSSDDSLALKGRAEKLDPGSVSLEEEVPDDEDGFDQKVSRARYLISYYRSEESGRPKEREQQSQDFNDWISSWPGTVVSSLNPLRSTHIVNSDGSVESGGMEAMSGFTIIWSESLEAVLSLAQKCPVLDRGGTVGVSEIVHLQ